MTPLTPTDPLPPLTGCGIHVHDSTANAADPVGDYRPTPYAHDVTCACRICHGCLAGVHSCCYPVVCIDTGERHECGCPTCEQRRTRQAKSLRDELAIFDEPAQEVLTAMLVQAMRGAA